MTKFKITGPGEYRTRDGRKAVVSHNDGGRYCWLGKIGEGIYNWNENGSFWATEIISVDDIISPWEEPATVTTVLEYKGITKKPSAPVTWLEFVQIMHTLESPKAEKQSEDEAHGNTDFDEAGHAAEALEHALYTTAGVFAKDRKKAALWLLINLQETGFSIVRTSTLGNRNGCYNTRTEKDVD